MVQPADRAPHWEWLAYAVSQGMPEDQARGLTRDQIRAALTLSPPLTGEPDLERMDQDPETAGVLQAVRRKPWECP
jgi:hypothetical protein